MTTLMERIRTTLGRDERHDNDDDFECLACLCTPHLTLCGCYNAEDIKDETWHENNTCQDCIKVLDTTGCPNCGCRETETCAQCDV